MRVIRIVTEGIPINVYDDMDMSIEEITEHLTKVMKDENIVKLVGKNSAAVIRPSKVSAINIEDQPDQIVDESMKKQEQKDEDIDMIVDADPKGVE